MQYATSTETRIEVVPSLEVGQPLQTEQDLADLDFRYSVVRGAVGEEGIQEIGSEHQRALSADYVARLADLLGPSSYLSVRLDGEGSEPRTIHITQSSSGLFSIHEVSDELLTDHARLTCLKGRCFVSAQHLTHEDFELGGENDLERLVSEAEEAKRRLFAEPTIVMPNPQGVHEWEEPIIGLPDTGGQNVYVQDLTRTLAMQGFHVAIANRAGPSVADIMLAQVDRQDAEAYDRAKEQWGRYDYVRKGLHLYPDDNVSLLFLEDGYEDEFIPKEDLYDRFDGRGLRQHFRPMGEHLSAYLKGANIVSVFSHYCDGGEVARHFSEASQIDSGCNWINWVPHSLGTVKRDNLIQSGREEDPALRLDERIEHERAVLSSVHMVHATSEKIRRALVEDYRVPLEKIGYLPPGIDTSLFFPRGSLSKDDPRFDATWNALKERSSYSIPELQQSLIVLEASRTDESKGKDVAMRAAIEARRLLKEMGSPVDIVFVTNVNTSAQDAALVLKLQQIARNELGEGIILFEQFPDWMLPELYRLARVYLSPSTMEGFGMSAQQGAACGLPIVTTPCVPFATEALAAEALAEWGDVKEGDLVKGAGAFIFNPNDYESAARALVILALNPELRKELGSFGYERVRDSYSWQRNTERLMRARGFSYTPDGRIDKESFSGRGRKT
jgi:mannosylfructose-phosphate synthase